MKKETESEERNVTQLPVDWSSDRAKWGRRHTADELVPPTHLDNNP